MKKPPVINIGRRIVDFVYIHDNLSPKHALDSIRTSYGPEKAAGIFAGIQAFKLNPDKYLNP